MRVCLGRLKEVFMKKKNVLNKVMRLWFCCIYLDKCQTFLYKYDNVAQVQLTVRIKFCLVCLDTFFWTSQFSLCSSLTKHLSIYIHCMNVAELKATLRPGHRFL